ncbi:unnamed protein product [Lasius platythorax]|uniref:Uncharacterized protein n=2 Tax=Lasius TaxID=488720 RepID=A0A0J7LAS4_LASNI|nr:hypothetical protein RF55_364 [Lasius niger]
MKTEMRSAGWAGRRGNLDSIGVMTIAGAAGQTTGSAGLVGGAVAPRTAAGRCSGRPLGRVRAVRAALSLDDALLGASLRTAAVRIRAGRAARAGVGVRIAVLLLGRPHPGVRIVADHVVARRLRIRGYIKVNDMEENRLASGKRRCVSVDESRLDLYTQHRIYSRITRLKPRNAK